MLRQSIQAGLDNREEAMEHALQFGRGLDSELADRFIRRAPQVRRDMFDPPVELSLMEKAKAWREKSDYRGCLVLSRDGLVLGLKVSE